MTPEEIAEIEPALEGDIYGGYYTESNITDGIYKFSSELAEACERRGVSLRISTFVDVIDATNERIAFSSHPVLEKRKKSGILTEIFDKAAEA